MALNAASNQCRFSYMCAAGANDLTKMRSIAEDPGGQIRIAADHDLVTAIGHLLKDPAAGFVEITLHLGEFLVLPGINLEQRFDVHPPTWSIRLQWLSALWAAMINTDMDSGRLESIELMWARVQDGLNLVTIEERTLGMPNVIQNPVTEDTRWVHISPRRLRAGDGTNVVFSQMRNMVTGHWGPDSQDECPFEAALDMLFQQPVRRAPHLRKPQA